MSRYALRGAVQFLTRIPAPTPTAPDLTASVAWFPVVGGAIGLIVGLVVAAAAQIMPMALAATLGLAVSVLVTGAFHEDGLADVADAFAGGWNPDERLRILDDPRHGTYGVVALVVSVVARIAAVAALAPVTAVAALVTAHSLARAVAVGSMRLAPTARPTGLGADYVRRLSARRVVAGVMAGIVIGAVAVGWWVVPALAVAVFGAAIVNLLAIRRIGGLSGDVLGTIEQVAEIGILVTVVALAEHHPLWWS